MQIPTSVERRTYPESACGGKPAAAALPRSAGAPVASPEGAEGERFHDGAPVWLCARPVRFHGVAAAGRREGRCAYRDQPPGPSSVGPRAVQSGHVRARRNCELLASTPASTTSSPAACGTLARGITARGRFYGPHTRRCRSWACCCVTFTLHRARGTSGRARRLRAGRRNGDDTGGAVRSTSMRSMKSMRQQGTTSGTELRGH